MTEPVRTLVLGATGAIGSALVAALSERGPIVGLSRVDGLDWWDPDRAEATLLAQEGPFDLIFDATGALHIDTFGPEKRLAAIDAGAMAAQFAVNAIGPALVLKHYNRLLPRTGRSVFATLSARVGSIGDNRLGGWIAYRSAKAALNQIVRTAAIEIARKRPDAVVVAMHPGTVKTPLTTPVIGDRPADTPAEAADRILAVLDGLGAENSGGFYAYDGTEIPW
ncbi:MAG: SDR family oxidoreductase [Pseudomonadota bacterium]